jgi:hypothetical protein
MKFSKLACCLGLLLFAFANVLSVQAQEDTTPPVLVGFDFSPKQVDTTSTSATITFTGHVTDNLSGELSGWTVLATSPTAHQMVAASMNRVSGTALDGFYQGILTLPADSESGTWTIDQIHLFDAAGNSSFPSASALGFPSTFAVTSMSDTIPPVLANFDFSPKQVDTTSTSATITFTGHVTDNLSGELSGWTVLATSPTAHQMVAAGMNRVSGTALDGFYQGILTLPAHSESGTWTIDQIHLFDAAGNSSFPSASALGFPSTFTNVRSSPYKAFVQPPINADDSSVFSAKRGVIPVKFTLTQDDLPTCALPDATISLSRTAGGVLGSIDESTYSAPSDSGSDFRIDPTACQYIYNLAVSALGIGTYRGNISINGIVVGHAVFALK